MRKVGIAILVVGLALTIGASLSFGASKKAVSGSTLSYTLKEMSIRGQKTVASGPVTFVAKNTGTVAHELVVMRGTAALKVKSFKALEAGRFVGEVEGVEPGKSGKLTVSLKPGTYLLVCNIVGHYQLGMKTVLKVS